MRTSQPAIDECDLEPKLAGVFWAELPGLELNDNVPELLNVKEQ